MEIKAGDIVLCEFYFTDSKTGKNRPVLVLKDNLPFDDFIAIPISSQIKTLHRDEVLLEPHDFSEGDIPKVSKVILRKTFVVSKQVVIKRYGRLTSNSLDKYKTLFCHYFECGKTHDQ